ncbi:MAG: hypothetical protein ABIW76_14555, partial [Fibrobacteria bacterium]
MQSNSILFRHIWFFALLSALATDFASVEAQTMLDVYQGPRQFAMGGAGVALPDRARSANYNPALPALSFPRERIGLALHPTWRDALRQDFRHKDWNAPPSLRRGFGNHGRFPFGMARGLLSPVRVCGPGQVLLSFRLVAG